MIFAFAAAIVAWIWMAWQHGDFIGIFISIIAGGGIAWGITYLESKIELRRR